jgi:hypothetical protein
MTKKMTRQEWLDYGLANKYCSMPLCVIHELYPMTEEEQTALATGGDVCLELIRPYKDETERLAVETVTVKGEK